MADIQCFHSNDVVLLRYSTEIEVFSFYFYLRRFLSYFLLFITKGRFFSHNVVVSTTTAIQLKTRQGIIKKILFLQLIVVVAKLLKMSLHYNVLPFCSILTFKTVTLILIVSYRLSIMHHHVNFTQKYSTID